MIEIKKIKYLIINNILYFLIIDNFFKIVAHISIFLFKFELKNNLFFKKKIITVIQVDTFGDSLDQVMLVRLLNMLNKKKYLIIGTDNFPNNIYFRFFLKKDSYYFYNEKFYLKILFFIKSLPFRGEYLIQRYNYIIRCQLIKNFNEFVYFENLSSWQKADLQNKILDKRSFSDDFKKSFVDFYSKDSFDKSHRILSSSGNKKFIRKRDIKGYDINYKDSLFKKLNLIKKKYVCLNFRKSEKDIDLIINNHRSHFNITNFFSLIKFLNKKNYTVVLTGSPNVYVKEIFEKESKLKVIDYRNSGLQNLKNDIYVFANCSFYIGPLSGPTILAMYLNKPILLMDLVNYADIVFRHYKKIIFCPKKIIEKKNNRILSIKESLYLPSIYKDRDFDNKKYATQDLTSEERLNAVKLFLKMKSNNSYFFYSKWHKKMKFSLDPVVHKDIISNIKQIFHL
jgi:putative glycosyltransferase (TIGR04372 family)